MSGPVTLNSTHSLKVSCAIYSQHLLLVDGGAFPSSLPSTAENTTVMGTKLSVCTAEHGFALAWATHSMLPLS